MRMRARPVFDNVIHNNSGRTQSQLLRLDVNLVEFMQLIDDSLKSKIAGIECIGCIHVDWSTRREGILGKRLDHSKHGGILIYGKLIVNVFNDGPRYIRPNEIKGIVERT